MINLMLIVSVISIICMVSTKLFYKLNVPILLIFIFLGMLFGSDGLVGIHFDDFEFTGQMCSLALVFIMFYGGFGTKWKLAKPVALPSLLLSSLGVVMTAGLTGLFCHFVLKTTLIEGFLIGSIVASTDAASVFAILRAQKLNLKGHTGSILELESGSNDPMAYMLTITILSMMKNPTGTNILDVVIMILVQVVFAVLVGVLLAKGTVYLLKHAHFEVEGFYTIFVVSITLLSYALAEWLGGNGYLAVYLTGIIIGNSKIPQKKIVFHFFDGISWIMQIMLFFMLGLLSFPSRFSSITGTAIAISLFMLFVARPLTVFIILAPFKFSIKEKLFISWVGLRGAGSVVFAIFAITHGVNISFDIFHTIFFIALFSVLIQGSLIPKLANSLDLVDKNEGSSILKTFTDYAGDIDAHLLEVEVRETSPWKDKPIIDSNIPEDVFIIMIKRGNKIVIPKGSTLIKKGDILVIAKEV